MEPLTNISLYISENAKTLANEIVENVIQKLQLNISEREKEQAIHMYIEFLNSLGNILEAEEVDKAPESLVEWSKKNAEQQAASGGDISEIIVRYPPTREAFNEILTRISTEFGLSVKENAFVLKRINAMLDVSLNETAFAFERLSIQYKEKTEKELAQRSAPVVPVKDDVVILSLSGDLNPYKTDFIMTNVIPEISDMGVNTVIVDFSGVLTINEEIANSLYQIGKMFRVMGIEVISSGLRPDIVQTAVKSGIDLSAVQTFANVKQALEKVK